MNIQHSTRNIQCSRKKNFKIQIRSTSKTTNVQKTKKPATEATENTEIKKIKNRAAPPGVQFMPKVAKGRARRGQVWYPVRQRRIFDIWYPAEVLQIFWGIFSCKGGVLGLECCKSGTAGLADGSFLGNSVTAAQLSLDQLVGVRIPVPQLF